MGKHKHPDTYKMDPSREKKKKQTDSPAKLPDGDRPRYQLRIAQDLPWDIIQKILSYLIVLFPRALTTDVSVMSIEDIRILTSSFCTCKMFNRASRSPHFKWLTHGLFSHRNYWPWVLI